MGHTSSTLREFERLLEDTRDQLSTVRDTYSQLERTESIPDWVIQSIGDLDRELDDLNEKLEVSEQDIQTAEQTARRVTTLAGVIDAFRERQRTIAEAATERVCTTLSIIADQIQENGLSSDTSPSIDTLQQQCSMLEALIENERYAQVLQHDRVSPRSIEPRIRELDESLQIPERTHARVHLDIVSKLLDGIHESLAMLGEENDDRVAYRDELKNVKSAIDEVEKKLQSDSVPSPEQTTRPLFDECLTMSGQVAQAAADQRLADTLAEMVRERDFMIDCDVAAYEKAGDGVTLLDALGDEITSKAELSEVKRLEQLLVEHDGSIVRTAEATDYTVDAIIEELSQLYQAGNVSDVHVEFGK